jgi:hypothetical protein
MTEQGRTEETVKEFGRQLLRPTWMCAGNACAGGHGSLAVGKVPDGATGRDGHDTDPFNDEGRQGYATRVQQRVKTEVGDGSGWRVFDCVTHPSQRVKVQTVARENARHDADPFRYEGRQG